MITGFHALMYSDDAEATRAFFRDVLGWHHVDAGDGWLIFRTPPAEIGVHPTTPDLPIVPTHQTSLMCDDIETTCAALRERGVNVRDEIRDEGFGLTTSIDVPGAGWMMLYEPRHPVAHSD